MALDHPDGCIEIGEVASIPSKYGVNRPGVVNGFDKPCYLVTINRWRRPTWIDTIKMVVIHCSLAVDPAPASTGSLLVLADDPVG